MGWLWEDERSGDGDVGDYRTIDSRTSTRRVVRSQCRTEEIEPGRFVRRCENTEEILKDCFGRSPEVVESTKEYTEDDVTDQVMNGGKTSHRSSVEVSPFSFPGLRGDLDGIENHMFGGFERLVDATENMIGGLFGPFGPAAGGRRPRGGWIDESSQQQQQQQKHPHRHADFSGLSKDV